MRRTERISIFVSEIWKWYSTHKRDLPWRDLAIQDDTERAYQILVSEIMLQQTQVSRVKIVFKDFLERFPKISDLASATNREVILAWRGMGYNNRALRLRDAAQTASQNNNTFPREMKELQALPGVGHYTAAAIRNFAFGLETPCLDTNIRRILHRTFVGPEHSDGTWRKDDTYLLKIAEEVLEEASKQYEDAFARCCVSSKQRVNETTSKRQSCAAADWHAALMDFGSLVCTKRNPKWDICPLTSAGIMKAAYKVPALQGGSSVANHTRTQKREPGRMVGSTYIPNRIFRGKVIEELRDCEKGMTLLQLGREICIDWNPSEHTTWLEGIVDSLKRDHLISVQRGKFVLAE